MDPDHISRWLIFLGLGLVAAGVLFWLFSKIITWKEIPGTLKMNLGGVTCVFPILLSIILSVVLTIVLNLIVRFLNK
jgi:hypothetical protein